MIPLATGGSAAATATRRRRGHAWTAALICNATLSLSLALPARSAQPLITDDAAVVAVKSCQFETWFRSDRDGRQYWAVPACNAFADIELSAGGARVDADDDGRSSQMVLQAKMTLIPQGEGTWAFGGSAGMLRDTAEARGRSAFQTYYAKALVSLYPSHDVEIDLNLGGANTVGSGTYALAGAALQYRVIDRVQVLLEAFRDEPGRAKAQGGLRFIAVPDRFEIFASYGARVGNGAGSWWMAGVRLQSPPFLP